MQSSGHPEWIAETDEEYIVKAVKLASGLSELAAIRRTLSKAMRNSPLMDENDLVRHLEKAYRGMWEKYCEEGKNL